MTISLCALLLAMVKPLLVCVVAAAVCGVDSVLGQSGGTVAGPRPRTQLSSFVSTNSSRRDELAFPPRGLFEYYASFDLNPASAPALPSVAGRGGEVAVNTKQARQSLSQKHNISGGVVDPLTANTSDGGHRTANVVTESSHDFSNDILSRNAPKTSTRKATVNDITSGMEGAGDSQRTGQTARLSPEISRKMNEILHAKTKNLERQTISSEELAEVLQVMGELDDDDTPVDINPGPHLRDVADTAGVDSATRVAGVSSATHVADVIQSAHGDGVYHGGGIPRSDLQHVNVSEYVNTVTRLGHTSYVDERTHVHDPAHVDERTHVHDPAHVHERTHVYDPAHVHDPTNVHDPAHVHDPTNVHDPANVHDPGHVHDPANVHNYETNHHYRTTSNGGESDYAQYGDYTAYQNYGERDHDFPDLESSPTNDHYVNYDQYNTYDHHYSGHVNRFREAEKVESLCEPEKCFCAVFTLADDPEGEDNLSGEEDGDYASLEGISNQDQGGINDLGYYNQGNQSRESASATALGSQGPGQERDSLGQERGPMGQEIGEPSQETGQPGLERGQPRYGVLCNASFSVRNFSGVAQDSCKVQTTKLVVKDQLELCRVTRLDFHNFQQLTYLAITHSGLREVEDGAFGNLPKLRTLDLRKNQLHALSWRSLWPASRPGDNLRHITTTDNPLDPSDCKNMWLQTWKEQSTGLGRPQRTWSQPGARSQHHLGPGGGGGGGPGSVTGSGVTEAGGPGGDLLSDSTTDDCPGTGPATSSTCYLCPAQLSVEESDDGSCRKFLVTCSARGLPLPEIEWDVPQHLVMVKRLPNVLSASDNATVTSTITLVYNVTQETLVAASSPPTAYMRRPSVVPRRPLSCLAQNDRFLSVEETDIRIESDVQAKPRICWTEFKRDSTRERFYFKAQAAPNFTLGWWFSPCPSFSGGDFDGKQLSYYVDTMAQRSSYIEGYLIFPDTTGGAKRGDYELKVTNQFGAASQSVHFSRRRLNTQPCNTSIGFEIFPDERWFPQTPAASSPSLLPLTPCLLPSTTTAPTSTTTTTTAASTATSAITVALSGSSIATANITLSPPELTVESSTSALPPSTKLFPLSITLTIGACVVVIVIGAILLLLRNLRRGHTRPHPDADPCPDSPFQITFIDEDCQKKSDGLQLQELMPLSADRLVDNPEYMGNGKISPSKPQARVIPRDHVKFVSELGEGAFGRVYLGIMEEGWGRATQVAVKTLKSVGAEARLELEREVEMLNNLKHKNIVSFFGVCANSDPLLMVFEYMEHGDLNNYLRSHNEDVALLSGEEAATEPLSVMDCLQIALQVAAGMKYLASQHYVHRDLATRNCLVGAHLVVKIGDFGMSRDVYTTDYYQFGGRTLLPVRWMPPESILYRRFTIESDIWSFGVVLWEIFTGGKQPWYGYTNQEVITQITAGKMLNCPERCPSDMYRIMLSCWSKNPQERHPMATLYDRIRSLTTVEPHVLDYD
ncbi:uncharacterized protein [Procambarus clarkii]|uniref:uncharacterized protein isoform X2 n=1 Tax=Procambarus clarkii TaxID=6728 RepID=UPI003742784B